MKKFLIAGGIAVFATAAIAGGYDAPVAEPMIEPVVIEENTSSSAGGVIVPILALILLAAAVAAD
ncbi:hypothetical protein HKCCE3408_03210 [Rhodobacterales bacterium HKCCE3408]|nr:hypothetical protein [Rhodobacterales bacterium HKCCE3408]